MDQEEKERLRNLAIYKIPFTDKEINQSINGCSPVIIVTILISIGVVASCFILFC